MTEDILHHVQSHSSPIMRAMLSDIYQHLPQTCDLYDDQMVDEAIRTGDLEVVKWAVGKGCPINEFVLKDSINQGHTPIAQFLIQYGVKIDSSAVCAMLHAGNLELLQLVSLPVSGKITWPIQHPHIIDWLLQTKHSPTNQTLIMCIGTNNYDMLVRLYPLCKDANKTQLMQGAQDIGNIRMVKYLRQKWIPLQKININYSFLCIWEYAHQNGVSLPDRLVDIAAQKGDLQFVQWCVSHNQVPTSETFKHACRVDNLELLQWLWNSDCPASNNIRYPHINNIQWLISVGAQPSGHMSKQIVNSGGWDVFNWWIGNDYPISKRICIYAFRGGNPQIIDWIIDNNHISKGDAHSVFVRAIRLNIPDIIRKLHTLGYPLDDELLLEAVTQDNYPIVQLLTELGCQLDITSAIKILIDDGNRELLQLMGISVTDEQMSKLVTNRTSIRKGTRRTHRYMERMYGDDQ